MPSSLSKRKLGDYAAVADSLPPPISPIRNRKDKTPLRSPSRLEFSVTITNVFWENILDFHAHSSDTVKSIHDKIHSITGIPVTDRRLFHGDEQLHWQQTLAECKIENFAELSLVGRMRSTKHWKACQIINECVSFIFIMCKEIPPLTVPVSVKLMLAEFLSMIPRSDLEQASEHLKMFSASSAPAALVMLYMSRFRSNRSAADRAIKHFVYSIRSIMLPIHKLHECLPIILEFCKLLKKAARIDDPLYCYCRSSLGAMIHCIVVEECHAEVEIPDVFPFVEELAAKLSHGLDLSVESRCFLGLSLVDISDFSAFSLPLRKAIKGCDPIDVLSTKDLRGIPHVYTDAVRNFYRIFCDLLSKLEWCLGKLEGKDTLCIGFSYDLEFMKELNIISKIYNGCESLFWEAMTKRKGAFSELVVKCAKRGEDHSWISECKEATNFEARRHLAMLMFPKVKYDDDNGNDDEERHEMLIDRSHLLTESFEYMKHADIFSLRGSVLAFKNEEATGPGVLREWVLLVCQEIFNPQNALFVACSNDRRRFYPSPVCKVDPLHLEYFRFSGKMIALALMQKIQVGIVFDRLFFLQLAGRIITLEDIRDADPLLYNSCKRILEMDPELVDQDALCLTFVHEVEELGTRKTVDLCTNGKSIVVNSINRRQYVDSLIQHLFVISVADQVEYFARGFADIMICPRFNQSFFKCLEPEDLDLMLHGSESAISVDDWKAHTKYHGFKETDDQISWFWKIVGEMTVEQEKNLLFFWTSIKYLPVKGFSGLASQLHIYKTCESYERLPSSHTCFYQLCFPAYPTSDVMHDRLSIITQEHVGCSFGTG